MACPNFKKPERWPPRLVLQGFKNINSNGKNVAKRNSKSKPFFFFMKIVKVEPTNEGQSFFLERDAFSAHKTSLVISFTSLFWNGMNQKLPLQVWTYLIWHNSLLFSKNKYLKKFFVLHVVPSNKKNSFDHHNSGSLRIMTCWKALCIFHPPKKFQKIHLKIGIVVVCPKSLNSIYGTHSPLGVNI